jgi:hypothetical protein
MPNTRMWSDSRQPNDQVVKTNSPRCTPPNAEDLKSFIGTAVDIFSDGSAATCPGSPTRQAADKAGRAKPISMSG